MSWNKEEEFPLVRMSREDYEAYIEWANEYQNTYKTRFHKGALAELFRNGDHSVRELKVKRQTHTHTNSKTIGALHLKVIQEINNRWKLDQLEDKSTFKVKHFEIKNIISTIFNKIDERTIKRRRDEVLPSLELETIQEKGQWFIVHKTYSSDISNDKVTKYLDDTAEKVLDFLINSLIKNGSLACSYVKRELGKNVKQPHKVFKLFEERAKAKGAVYEVEEEKYFLREVAEQEIKIENDPALEHFDSLVSAKLGGRQ